MYPIERCTYPVALCAHWPMPRRLEDRIKDLCVKAIAAPDSHESNDIFKELQDALQKHNERIRKLAASPIQERRKAATR